MIYNVVLVSGVQKSDSVIHTHISIPFPFRLLQNTEFPVLYSRSFLVIYFQYSRVYMSGEGNGNPFQYSCLENPMDGGAWWAAVHGVAKSLHFTFTFHFMHWRRKWQPTPVFLPGKSQGRRSLVGCHLWSRTESDTTEAT